MEGGGGGWLLVDVGGCTYDAIKLLSLLRPSVRAVPVVHFLVMVTRVQITVPICPISCCELLRTTFYFSGQLPIGGRESRAGEYKGEKHDLMKS